MRVLLVEDDESIAKEVASSLTQQNYAVDVATDGRLGWQFVETIEYSLVLLDVVLPNLDGISFCQRLRQEHYQMPVLLLTAQNATTDKVMALDAGADDYVVKPFELQELMARIRALLRRGSSFLPPVMQWGRLRLDPSICEATYDGKPLNLTPKEYSLLKFFLHNCNRILTRSAIVDHVWTFDNPPEEDTIKSHIKGLRRKFKAVEATADPIETVYGLGYRLKPLPYEKKHRTTPLPFNLDEGWTQQQMMTAATQVWEWHRAEISRCISTLEQAVAALRKEAINGEPRLKAKREAHKLAGWLSISGIPRGSQLSWEIEFLLQVKVSLDSIQAQRLTELVTALRRELDQTINKWTFKPILDNVSLSAKLMNRRETVRALEHFLCLAQRHCQPLYLVILKLDSFRQIGYRHGDVAEDVVTQQSVQFLQRTFRSTDVVARWNDGACVMGLYGMTKVDGAKRLTKALKLLHQNNFITTEGTKFQVTFRDGAAGYPEDGADWQTLYRAACVALFQAGNQTHLGFMNGTAI